MSSPRREGYAKLSLQEVEGREGSAHEEHRVARRNGRSEGRRRPEADHGERRLHD